MNFNGSDTDTTCALGHRIAAGAAYCDESIQCRLCLSMHHIEHPHMPHSEAIRQRDEAVALLRRLNRHYQWSGPMDECECVHCAARAFLASFPVEEERA